jgi:hypothetical protein
MRNGMRCIDDGGEAGTGENNERPNEVCYFPDGQESKRVLPARLELAIFG